MINAVKRLVNDVKGMVFVATRLKTVIDDTKVLVNDIRSKLQGNYLLSDAGLAIGTTKTAVATGGFDYFIGGKKYSKAVVAAGTAPGNDIVPKDKFGAVAFDIGADGTIDVIEAPANAIGYASAALAVAALPVPVEGHARMGWITASSSAAAFTFGTTELDDADSTVVYTDAPTMFNAIGAEVGSSTVSIPRQTSY